MNELDILVGPLSDLEDTIILIAPWRSNYRLRKRLRLALVRPDFRKLLELYYFYDDELYALRVEAEKAGFEVHITPSGRPRFKPLEGP
jgi:hypothetical protein